MLPSQALLPAVVFALAALQALASDTFMAAVYEHAVILPHPTQEPVPASDALALMNKNMDVLEGAIKEAAQQGAHIIVTPEDGIYGWQFTRESIYPYLEDIPDPAVNWIPCTDPSRFGPAPVQERLSCMARNNSIYVVANIGDKKLCNSSDPSCPRDGRYQYNTDVVFDTQGKLVARYHKYNLFLGENQFNYPKEPEAVTFETPFGKFGIFTCFDILFYEPAVVLVSKMQVDTVLFPTAWMNVLPFLTAIEFHSAWAMGMGVNLLSANTHNTSMEMTGSGIYAPAGARTYSYNMKTEDGHLLIAELDAHPRLSPASLPAICTLLKCPSTNLSTCGQPVETAQTKFEMFSLSGTFGTSYIFPEVLYSGVQLAPGEFEVLADGRLINQNTTSKPVLSVTLFGRWYEKDPPSTDQASA
ncbi:pantetheinase-like isoform X2 [Molothrus aeneus]|uniref:pantetheinase-like isoform X2 n=1 Tax=Molothrus aeneus TaxID=84833 RepID=UPI003457B1E3